MIGPYCLWEPEKLTLNSVASSGNCSKMDDGIDKIRARMSFVVIAFLTSLSWRCSLNCSSARSHSLNSPKIRRRLFH